MLENWREISGGGDVDVSISSLDAVAGCCGEGIVVVRFVRFVVDVACRVSSEIVLRTDLEDFSVV